MKKKLQQIRNGRKNNKLLFLNDSVLYKAYA